MMSTQAIRAGRAFVELFADDAQLRKGLKGASDRLKAFGGVVRNIGLAFTAMGVGITAPLMAAAKAWASAGDELYDMAQRTDMSVEQLSALSYAAAHTGADMAGVEVAVRRMQKSIAGVADAAEGTTGKMDDLGLSARDFAGKGVYQQFAALAAAISRIPDATARSAAAMNIFGRSGTMIVPMLERLNELTGEARQFGFIRSTASAKQAKEFADALMMLTKAAKGLWYSLGSAVAPILKDLADRLRDGAIWLRDFAKEHPGLIRLAFRLGAGLVLAGAMVAALGSALQLTSAALGIYAAIQAIAAKKAVAANLAQTAGQAALTKATISHVTVLGAYSAVQARATQAAVVDVGVMQAHVVGHRQAATAVALHALALAALQRQLTTTAIVGPVTSGLRTYTTAQLTALSATKLLPGAVASSGGVMAAFGAIMAKVGVAISAIAAPVVLAVGSVLVLAAGLTYAALKARAAEKAQRELEKATAEYAAVASQAAAARADVRSAQSPEQQADALGRLAKAYQQLQELEQIQGGEGSAQRAEAYRNLAAEASANLAKVQDAMAQARQQAQQLDDSINDLVADLSTQVATFGMSSHAAQLYGLQLKGATDAQLEQAAGLMVQLNHMEAVQKRREKLRQAQEDFNRRMFDVGKQIVDTVGTPAEKRQVRMAELTQGGLSDQQAQKVADAEALAARVASRKDRLEQAGQTDAQRNADIAELELRAKYKGVELERQLLELEHQRARAQAARLGASVDLVDREYALREQLAQQGPSGLNSRGVFSVAALQSLQGSASADRTARATEETARTVKEQLALTRKAKGLVFG